MFNCVEECAVSKLHAESAAQPEPNLPVPISPREVASPGKPEKCRYLTSAVLLGNESPNVLAEEIHVFGQMSAFTNCHFSG